MEKNPTVWRKFENESNPKFCFIRKETRSYDVSVLMNHQSEL